MMASIAPASAEAQTCGSSAETAVQILGSGGPIADDARASSGYLVWHDGRAVALIDAGSGTFLRMGEAGARVNDLEFIGLSHFHTDHSADFPALIKSASFSRRQHSLILAGPDGTDRFPGVEEFVARLFDGESGAYRYLSNDVADNDAPLIIREVAGDEVATVWDGDEITVQALHVPHGIVPALAFRVQAGDGVMVFGSDQNGSNAAFIALATDADLLVMHMVIPESATGVASRLHARPSRIGEIAHSASAGQLVLSHLMARSLRNLEANVSTIKERYTGIVTVAEDLACFPLTGKE